MNLEFMLYRYEQKRSIANKSLFINEPLTNVKIMPLQSGKSDRTYPWNKSVMWGHLA